MKCIQNFFLPIRFSLMAGIVCGVLPCLAPEAAGQHTLIASDRQGVSRQGAWLGVKTRGQLKIHYFDRGEEQIGRQVLQEFKLPPAADELILSRDRLGVRTGRSLQFFDVARNFKPLPQFDFVLSETPTELLLLGDQLGVRIGRVLRFYAISANFKHRPEYDYTLPAGTSELVIAHNATGNWLGVRIGSQLIFYDIDRKYRPHPDYRFTLPANTEEIALSGFMLLARRGNVVSFYDFGQKIMQRPRLQITLEP